jgi:hypothetical protein
MTNVATPFQKTTAIGKPGDVFVVVGYWDFEEGKRELRERFGAEYGDCLVWGIYASRRAADDAAVLANSEGDPSITYEVVRVDAVNVHLELGEA